MTLNPALQLREHDNLAEVRALADLGIGDLHVRRHPVALDRIEQRPPGHALQFVGAGAADAVAQGGRWVGSGRFHRRLTDAVLTAGMREIPPRDDPRIVANMTCGRQTSA